jgi:hypothetical protein
MADLAPCVGITRIRFKGSSEFLRTSQPLGSPAIEKRIEIARLKSTVVNAGAVGDRSNAAPGGRALPVNC